MSERSLGDPVEPSSELDPSTYNVADFAAGIRPGRRSVQIRQRLDLYPALEAVVLRIEAADEGENVDDLIDEYEALKAQMLVTFVVEKRSAEYRATLYREAADELGITPGNGTSDVLTGKTTEEQGVQIALRMILGHIVEPDGVTIGDLQKLYENDPSQVDALTLEVQRVNAGEAEALTLDFSRRRSTNRGTPHSSTS